MNEKLPEPTVEECHNTAAMLGRRGGLKGGKARAKKLTPDTIYSTPISL